MTELAWVSGGVRLLKMMVELHRRGLQRLRIFPYEYPLAWRLEVGPSSFFSTRNGAYVGSGASPEFARHSSASELRYFGWEGVERCDAERLAKEFMKRFARLCEAGSGRDWEYSGWLSELSGHASRTRQLPFVLSEYFEPEPEKLTYLPLRDHERGHAVFEFPLPPSTSPREEALILRARCTAR
jgi:hypothetical protein